MTFNFLIWSTNILEAGSRSSRPQTPRHTYTHSHHCHHINVVTPKPLLPNTETTTTVSPLYPPILQHYCNHNHYFPRHCHCNRVGALGMGGCSEQMRVRADNYGAALARKGLVGSRCCFTSVFSAV